MRIGWEQTRCGELGPLVLGQLKNIKGPLEDLNPVLHTALLMLSYGVVSGLDLVSAANKNSTYSTECLVLSGLLWISLTKTHIKNLFSYEHIISGPLL